MVKTCYNESMKKVFLGFILCVLSGCASQNVLSDMRFQTNMAPPYLLASWHKIQQPGQPLKVYIEGDGMAFDANGQPTSNPTPHSTFLREIAAHDPSPNVVYLARPCQYVTPKTCSVKDWTTGRFSKNVVASTHTAVRSLMKKADTDQVILIGYSGGATVAGLVAVKNPQVVKGVITIAGVLDHEAWTTYHNDPPLTASENLADYKRVFNTLPQHHFVGEKDKVVPPPLVQDFVQDEDRVTVVKGATHDRGYQRIYQQIYDER